MDITISYSFIELLKSPLLTLLWRACHHLLDRFPSGTGAADPPSTQSESALVLQCLLTGQGLQPQPAWGLPLTSLWFIQVFPRLEVPKLNTHPLARAPPAQGKALHLSLLTLAWLLLVYSPRLDSFRGTPTQGYLQGHPSVTWAWCHLHTQWESTPSSPTGDWQ